MKKLILFLAIGSFAFVSMSGQAPQKINYQALIRDATDKPLVEKSVSLRFSILYKTVTGVVKYSETQTSTTDKNGMVSLKIGEGTPVTGTMSSVNWADGPYFLKIELKYTSPDYLLMGTTEMASTPFALFANSTPPISSLPKLSIASPSTTGGEESLFEVKNKDGTTVFAVYNEGVRVYTPTTATSTKGGFAVASFPSVSTGKTKEFFRVTADSVRIYIDTLSTKGTKGGFAIGTMSEAKAKNLEFMRVSADSVRIYVNQKSTKGPTKGGFAIGGFNEAKGITDNFLKLTPKNYFIGHNSGKNTTTGLYNSFLGYLSGYSNTTGSSNTFFGDSTGLSNTTGSWNVFMGKQAGYSNQTSVSNIYIGNEAGKMAKHTASSDGSYNVAIGTLAGYYNNGKANCFVGQEAGYTNKVGRWNVFVGTQSGYLNDTAKFNVFLGSRSGYSNKGDANVFIGNYAGYNNVGANYNVYLGNNAGTSSTSGDMNVMLGSDAGYNTTLGYCNTFVGNMAGNANLIGNYNIFMGNYAGVYATGNYNTSIGSSSGRNVTDDFNTILGYQAGYTTAHGRGNAFFGHMAGYSITTGDYNTVIGPAAGPNATSTGSNNVFVGHWAGYYETGSDKLYIDNYGNTSSAALIYGDFALSQLRLNAYVGISTAPSATYRLNIAGSAYSSVGFYIPSDIRLKQNVKSMDDDGVIEKVKDINVIRYNYVNGIAKGSDPDDQKYIGVVAQDIEKAFPEAVRTDEKGYKAVNLSALTSILFQAVKDQQKQIDSLKTEVKLLKTGK